MWNSCFSNTGHAAAVNKRSQHSQVVDSSGQSIASPGHAMVATSITNPLSGIPPTIVTSEMCSPSEVSGLCNYESSDKLKACRRNDRHLLSIINSESSVQVVSLLTELNSFTQKGLSSLTSKYYTQEGLNQALITACRRGHKQLVQTLVRVGADIEQRDKNGNTPLLICAKNGFMDIVRFLVSRHANVSAVNSVGNTALILSMRSAGSTDLTRFLLEQQGVDIYHQNQHGFTALHMAIHFMDVDTMGLLLETSVISKADTEYLNNNEFEYEMDSYFTNRWFDKISPEFIAERAGLLGVYEILKEHVITGTSPLELAIRASDIKSLDMFLDCQFFSSSERKRYVDSALKYMFTSCHHTQGFCSAEMKIIQRLLQYGADVNQDHMSALLSRAVELGDVQVVELLCMHGADMRRCAYPREQDPWVIAAKSGRQDLIELLLKYHAKIKLGGFYDSALDYALRNNHIECAKLLIQRGAKMDVQCALRFAVDHQVPGYMHFLFENYKPEIMDYLLQKSQATRILKMSAIEKGNCEIIGHIVDAGVDINEADAHGQTLLMMAKSREVAEFLIQRGADVNQVTTGSNGTETPLIHMIHHRTCSDASTVELCKVLIDNGASVNCRSGEGKTLLMMAASHDDSVDMLHMLLANGADVNDKDNKGRTALIHAIKTQNSKNVYCLIDSARDKKSVINAHNNEGLTPLMMSAEKGIIPIMKALIEGGADVNMKDNQENTALHHLLIASSSPSEEMLECLLKAGINVNCQNSDGLSPLMLAAKKSLASVMSSLLEAGADVNAFSEKDHSQTALSFIPGLGYVLYDSVLCIEMLLDRGASCSYLQHLCLHRLIIQNRINIIFKLIQRGAGPADVEVNTRSHRRVRSILLPTVSPFCLTLLHGQIPLARYFVDILFLTSSDLSMFACNKAMECLLKEGHQEDSLHFLHEVSSQPMSLVQLSLVAVSSAVGSSPGRETRVNSLPLPQIMKDRLLFKSEDDKHLQLSEHL